MIRKLKLRVDSIKEIEGGLLEQTRKMSSLVEHSNLDHQVDLEHLEMMVVAWADS